MAGLRIDYCGEDYRAEAGMAFTFGRGRGVDLHIDDNPQLHRRLGTLWHDDGVWWLLNTGSRIVITVADRDSPSSAAVGPGANTALLFAETAIRFTAGAATYELLVELDVVPAPTVDPPTINNATASAPTVDSSALPLTANQRLLLVALAEQALLHPGATLQVPTNKAVAARLGWSTTTFNRALDRLCRKLARSGVRGLVGTAGDLASDRRRRLVEHAVTNGLISTDDLSLLEPDTTEG